MVEELDGQYTAVKRSHGGFSTELQNLYCLGKQLASKQKGVLLACLPISKSAYDRTKSENIYTAYFR